MTVSERLAAVRQRIAESALKVGRRPDSIALVGVSKGAPAEAVVEAVEAGLTDLGENRVQEAATKIPAVARSVSTPVVWHLIGHLQSNKATSAVELFHTIHSLDSVRLAAKLSAVVERSLPVYVEVQFSAAPDRFGFASESVPSAFDAVTQFPHLSVVGLMTVAPLGLDEVATRRVFRSLREIRDRIQETHPHAPELGLSMGMTNDYPVAIEEGATVVRIGRAIFAA
ncbi:MAG: YggS family pyridoxal phosphate-dependent enzyme [Chloroflexi bacterium]|nr:YggS family pyridoxal phosphate-dependent enzyme [Chloroflexota bacterium]